MYINSILITAKHTHTLHRYHTALKELPACAFVSRKKKGKKEMKTTIQVYFQQLNKQLEYILSVCQSDSD